MFAKELAVPKSVDIQRELTDIHMKEWLREDVFHFKWWFLIAFLVILALIWWVMLDKSRSPEICLFVILSVIVFMGINEYGEELTLWDYPTDLIPIFPPLSSINLISFPLIYSQVYQRFGRGKGFVYAVIITSAVICFLFEPLLTWGGFYCLIHWQYYFSFPIYTIVAIVIKAAVMKIYAIREKSQISVPVNRN
ncbi:CBO0543 family protein [Caproiciproducens sp.]